MITINLRPGVKRNVQRGSAFGDFRTRMLDLRKNVREPWLAVAVGAWTFALLFLAFTWVRTATQLSSLEPKLEETKAEHRRYRDFIRQKRREERIRDSILVQIATIAAVDQERYVWPHLLDDIASALPEFTWLTEVSSIGGSAATASDSMAVPPVVVRIVGRTADLQHYTTFLRRLEASPWMMNVVPVEAKTIVEGNRALNSFTIQATYSRADSSRIRTVPVLESVVR